MAASRRVPVVSLNSSVSDSPEAARAAILINVKATDTTPTRKMIPRFSFVVHGHPRLDERSLSRIKVLALSGIGKFQHGLACVVNPHRWLSFRSSGASPAPSSGSACFLAKRSSALSVFPTVRVPVELRRRTSRTPNCDTTTLERLLHKLGDLIRR